MPSSFLPRQQSPAPSAGRAVGGGMSGVFDNLAARPDRHIMAEGEGGLQYVPEDESKDAPPVGTKSFCGVSFNTNSI